MQRGRAPATEASAALIGLTVAINLLLVLYLAARLVG